MSERDELNMGVISRGILEQIRLAPDDRMEVVLAILNGDLSPASLAAIGEAIESGNPLYCIANKEVAILAELVAGVPYEQATGEEATDE